MSRPRRPALEPWSPPGTRRIRAIADAPREAVRPARAAPRRRSARRARAHRAEPAHERPERRAGVRRPATGLPRRAGGRSSTRPPSRWPTRSAAAGSRTRRRRASRRSCARCATARARYDLSRLRAMSDAEARDYLMSLPGIGPKTAAVVLSFALGRDAMPVDTHVHRVTKRLGLIPPKATAERADRILHELIPDGLRTPMHVGFIRLGREICKAPTPRCRQCPLKDLCPTAPRYLWRLARRRRRRLTATPVRAGEGNRTPVSSLGSSRSAIEPHPRGPTGWLRRSHSVASLGCDGRARFRRRHAPASVERHDRAVS